MAKYSRFGGFDDKWISLGLAIATGTISALFATSVRAQDLLGFPQTPQVLWTSTTIAQDVSENTAANTAFKRAIELYQQGTPQSRQAAIAQLETARTLYQESNDREAEGQVLGWLGRIHSELGEYQQAIAAYEAAIPLRSNHPPAMGHLFYSIGKTHVMLGQRELALDYYNQALPIFERAGDRRNQAVVLTSLGLIYSNLGKKRQALDYHRQALSLWIDDRTTNPDILELEYPLEVATILNNLATVYDDLGEPTLARDRYDQALSLYRKAGDKHGEATILNNLGHLNWTIGQNQQALDSYNRSLSLWQDIDHRPGISKTLNNIGLVYWTLGEHQLALDVYQQSLSLRETLNDTAGEAITLNNIGNVYRTLGDNPQAIDYYDRALPLHQSTGNILEVATTLHNLGKANANLGKYAEAIAYYEQALESDRANSNLRGEAYTLTNMGTAYVDWGKPEDSFDLYKQALSLSEKIGDLTWQATTHYHMARWQRQAKNFSQALEHIKTTIHIIEEQRTQLGDRHLRTQFFASKQDYYDFYIDLLMQQHQNNPSQGYDAIALEISEKARARSLLDLLSEANVDIRKDIDPQLLGRLKVLQHTINAKATRQTELLSKESTSEQATDIQQEINQLLQQYQQLQTQIRIASPRYAALTQPEPLTLADIQQQAIDDETVFLEYYIGQERSYVWAISQKAIASYELPNRDIIDRAVKEFRDILTHPLTRNNVGKIGKAAQELSQLILVPIGELYPDKKRLAIASHGSLAYIPFAALTLPNNSATPTQLAYRPLIADYEIVNPPSASIVALINQEFKQRQPAPKLLAIFADPVYHIKDSRLNESLHEPTEKQTEKQTQKPIETIARSARDIGISLPLARLIGTREEASTILSLAADHQKFAAFDFEVNRPKIVSNDRLSDYQTVHFATHGFFNSTNPALSGLVLSLVNSRGQPQDGFLRLSDVYNMKLTAELVVLSACQTGLGQNIRGEGIIGLTRGFLYAGAEKVMASLWYVDDRGTAELMIRFYQQRLVENLSPAAALQVAQREMWQDSKWKSPYFWSGFMLQGNW